MAVNQGNLGSCWYFYLSNSDMPKDPYLKQKNLKSFCNLSTKKSNTFSEKCVQVIK